MTQNPADRPNQADPPNEPVLSDGRLQLERVNEGHAEALTAAVQVSLTELAPFMPWASDDYDLSHSMEFINSPAAAHAFALIDPAAPVTDAGTANVAGVLGINDPSERDRFADIGWWLRTDVTGQGLATVGAQLVANYGFDQLGLHRIEIFMSVENPASRAIAERLGASYEGLLRGRLQLQGRAHDAHLYAMLATDDLPWRS